MVTKAVSYVDQPIPGIILLERYVEDEDMAVQYNRTTRIAAILVQAVEAAQVAAIQLQNPDMINNGMDETEDEPADGMEIPWVQEDAAAYQAMLQGAAAGGKVIDDPLLEIMKAAAAGGATGHNKSNAASKLEQEIMERIAGKKKETFDPFSVMEEVREGVRLDLGMTRLSREEVKMIVLVLTGKLDVDDLCVLVYRALSSGQGLGAMLRQFPVGSERLEDGAGNQIPSSPPTVPMPPISVVNLSYTFMGNTSIEMLGEIICAEGSPLRTIDISFCGLEERGCLLLARAFIKRKRAGIVPLRGVILSGNHISLKAATELGRALSPEQGKETPRIRPPKSKHGGYDEDSESEEEDEFEPETFGSATKGGPSADAAQKYFSKDHGLKVLHLGAALENAESTARFLQGLGPQCPVRELNLTSNSIGPDGIKLIVDFLEGKGMPKKKQIMPYLDRLDLSNNGLGNDGLTKLTRAISKRNVIHLVELRLSNNAIGHGGIETMMNKLLQHNLVSLSLDKNAIGDQGCQLVAASLQSMKSLARLNLGFNQIGSRGVNSLMRSLVACEPLTFLGLSGNIMKISGAVALAFTLAQHPRLEELNVDNCCLSQAAQCHIIAGIISNRWVPMKRMNGFEAGPPMVALGALKISAQNLSNEECFRIRKDEQMKTILQWMESNRVAKMAGRNAEPGGSTDSYQHFLTPDFVQSMNDVQGIPSQNAYLRLLGWLSRIPFDEDELISLRKYFYDSDGGSEDRGSDGYINLKLRGDLLAALESDVADEIRDEMPMLVQYLGSVGMNIDEIDNSEPEGSAFDYMKGNVMDKEGRVKEASENTTTRKMIHEEVDEEEEDEEEESDTAFDDDYDSDLEDPEQKKRRMYSAGYLSQQRDSDYELSRTEFSERSSMSGFSRASGRSMQHSVSDRSNFSGADRKRSGGLKARITMFPQFETKLEELKATATEMIECEDDPDQQEIILTQYAEASLTILRQLRYHCMNSGLDGWRQGSVKRKVLIIDDSMVTRKLVSRAFEKANFIVDTASNGAEGVEKLKKSIYDIAFMDIDMPVMNGFEATKKLREWEDAVRPGTRQPICALTAAYVDDFERSELMKFKDAGLDVMESKPCNIPRLFKVVDDVSPMFSDLSISVIQQGGAM